MDHPPHISSAQYWLRYRRYPMLLARLLFFALILYATWWVLTSLQAVLIPVTLSVLLAYLLDPTIDWFEARGFDRTVGIALLTGLAFLLFSVMALFLYPTVVRIGEGIYNDVPKLVDFVQDTAIPWFEGQLVANGLQPQEGARELVADLTDRLSAEVPNLLGSVTTSIGRAFSQTGAAAAWLFNLVLIPFLTFYFLRDFDIHKAAISEYLPVNYRDWIIERLTQMDTVVGAWLRGQIEVSIILGVLYALGLAITFGFYTDDPVEGVVSGVAIGMVGGLLNIVPYLGFFIAFSMATLIALLSFVDGSGWAPLVGVLLTFSLVQTLESYVVTPMVVGKKVGLTTVVVIIALLLGFEVLGLLGILLAIPVAGSLRVLLPDLLDLYRRSDVYLGELVWTAEDMERATHDAPPEESP